MEKKGSVTEEEAERFLTKGFRISGLFEKVKRDGRRELPQILPKESPELPHIYDPAGSKTDEHNLDRTEQEMNERYDFPGDLPEQDEAEETVQTSDEILHYDAVSTVVEEPPGFSPFDEGDAGDFRSEPDEYEYRPEETKAVEPYEDSPSVVSEMVNQFEQECSDEESIIAFDENEPILSIPPDEEAIEASIVQTGTRSEGIALEEEGVNAEAEVLLSDKVREEYEESQVNEPHKKNEESLTREDLRGIKTRQKLLKKLKSKDLATKKITEFLSSDRAKLNYPAELRSLQIELLKLERWVRDNRKRVVVIFEGLDPIGNGMMIGQIAEHFSPGSFRSEHFSSRSKKEKKEWYFQRYADHLPEKGEIVFFTGGWYDRAIFEPVNGQCTADEYGQFLKHVPEFETMVADSGVRIVKLWFSVSKKEQRKRFKKRKKNETMREHLTAFDKKAGKYWNDYKHYRELMFRTTHSDRNPWISIEANKRKAATTESIKYLLSLFDYEGRDRAATSLNPDPEIVKYAIE
ncbi:MAG: hypothetical protein R2681_18255 [Pyrinomonadaceae bacterium]